MCLCIIGMRMYCNCRTRRRHAHSHHNNNDLRKDLVIVKIIQSLFAQFGSTKSLHPYTHAAKCQIDTVKQWNSVYCIRTLNAPIVHSIWSLMLFCFALLFVNLFLCLRKQKQNKWIFKLRFGKISRFPIGEWMRNYWNIHFNSFQLSFFLLRWIVVFSQ